MALVSLTIDAGARRIAIFDRPCDVAFLPAESFNAWSYAFETQPRVDISHLLATTNDSLVNLGIQLRPAILDTYGADASLDDLYLSVRVREKFLSMIDPMLILTGILFEGENDTAERVRRLLREPIGVSLNVYENSALRKQHRPGRGIRTSDVALCVDFPLDETGHVGRCSRCNVPMASAFLRSAERQAARQSFLRTASGVKALSCYPCKHGCRSQDENVKAVGILAHNSSDRSSPVSVKCACGLAEVSFQKLCDLTVSVFPNVEIIQAFVCWSLKECIAAEERLMESTGRHIRVLPAARDVKYDWACAAWDEMVNYGIARQRFGVDKNPYLDGRKDYETAMRVAWHVLQAYRQ